MKGIQLEYLELVENQRGRDGDVGGQMLELDLMMMIVDEGTTWITNGVGSCWNYSVRMVGIGNNTSGVLMPMSWVLDMGWKRETHRDACC